MSLGGEAVIDNLPERERDLLQEAWVWRAVQVFARRAPVVIRLGRFEETIIEARGKVYHLPQHKQAFLDAARAVGVPEAPQRAESEKT